MGATDNNPCQAVLGDEAPHLSGAHPQHKGNGIHEVGLAATIGPNNGSEALEGSHLLPASIAFEIVHLCQE